MNRVCIGRMMAKYLRAVGFAAATAVFAQAQAPIEFEVASVRANKLDDHIVTIDVGPGGRFAARGYTLVLLMQRAYGVMDWNVTGGPGWIRTDRYDVTAKAMVDGNLTERQLKPMLQKLLAERFNLRLHKVSKEMSGYALIVGKDGSKLKAADDSEEHADTFRLNNAGLSGQGISMENFARYVAGKLGLVAVDLTGLKGLYDFNVHWTVEADQNADMRDALRPVVFATLQNQLGLKLNPQKISVEMLVIDSVEKASEN